MKNIKDFQLVNHGLEHEQYFQGHIYDMTSWEACVTGYGLSERAALDDCMALLSDLDIAIPSELNEADLSSFETLSEDCYYYISIDFILERESKHTPGPWVVDSDELDSCFVRQDNAHEFSEQNVRVASLLCGEGQDMQANARLISAAPDLLLALKTAIRLIESGSMPKSIAREMNQIRVALAKAEGK